MAVAELINWATVNTNNPAPIPPGPDGQRPRRIGLAMQEMMGSIARWRDTLSGSTGTLFLSSADPFLGFNETDAGANNRRWDMRPVSEQFRFRAVNDDDNSFTNWLTVDRTAQVIDLVDLRATTVRLTGNGDVTGTLTVASNLTVTAGNLDVSGSINFGAGNQTLDSVGGGSSFSGALTTGGTMTVPSGSSVQFGDASVAISGNAGTDVMTFSTNSIVALTINASQSLVFSNIAQFAAAVAGAASLRVPHGTAPSAPVNGDFWSTTAGFFGRVNGANVGPFSAVASLPDLSDVVSATNTNRFVLVANGTTGYVGRALVEADISNLQAYLTAEVNDLTAAVTWANVPNANITEGSVTQHAAAIKGAIIVTSTSTALNDITNAINTGAAKVAGYEVFNTTTNTPVWAVGNADGSVWVNGAGTTVHTPV